MKQGVRQGVLRPEVKDLAPVSLMGMVRAMAIRNGAPRAGTEFTDDTDRLVESFLRGVSV